MTTILQTYVDRKPVDATDQYRVYFRVTGGSGEPSSVRSLDVNVTGPHEHPSKLAELLAIKHILLHSRFVGENRNGEGLILKVSSGCIKKIQKKHTTNADMIVHGRFLQVRFNGAVISTDRHFDWVKGFTGEVIDVSLEDCGDKPVKTHVGELHLTMHAVERFSERMAIPSIDRSWRRLAKLMTSGEWKVVKPVSPLRDGERRRTTETWAIRKGMANPVSIVIVRNASVNRVVTVMA
tara:strand:- start:1982 stop:2692 length:711 start_codon:yes stop_codon:yes gene_type:complete